MSCLCPAAIAAVATPGRSGTTNEPEAEMAKNAGKSFRVFVPGNNGATGNFPRINAGNRKNCPCHNPMMRRMSLRPRAS